MAENTRLKDLASTIERLSENNTQRDAREANHVNRLQNVETSLEVIQRSIEALTGGIERLSVSHSVTSAGGFETRHHQPFNVHQVKLDFPRFDGSDPLNWLFHASKDTSGAQLFKLSQSTPAAEYYHQFTARLVGDSIGKILSRSPCLETLELDNCYGVSRIDATSNNFKNLVLTNYGMSHRFADSLGRHRDDIEEELLSDLLSSLSHVKDITLGDKVGADGDKDRITELMDGTFVAAAET
ncbi:hypothetical protein Tco_0196208 [Tanacetum coccineum]